MITKKIKIKQEDMPKTRKPIAPPSITHKDKSKYSRKKKHKKNESNE